MPNTLSAKKRVRQNIKRRSRNRWRKRTLRTAIKDLHEKVLHGTSEEADAALRETQKIADRTAARGVIHKNTAARLKSRLSARVKAKKQGA
jgi:small subunit ribosomal protein S20